MTSSITNHNLNMIIQQERLHEYYINKQRTIEYTSNKIKQVSNDVLKAYNERQDRVQEALLEIYDRNGKFVNKISQIIRRKINRHFDLTSNTTYAIINNSLGTLNK